MNLETVKAHARLACLSQESLARTFAWLGEYERRGNLSFVLAAILSYHYEDVIRGRVNSLPEDVATARLRWLKDSSEEQIIASASPVPGWALETSRIYFKNYYAHLPQFSYQPTVEEELLLEQALAWLQSHVRFAPLRRYECVAMPRESEDPLLHYPARIPTRVLSVVSIDPETSCSQAPIIITPAGMSLTPEERVITIVHETIHVAQAHPPQIESMHSDLIEGITDALSLLAVGKQAAFKDMSSYLGGYVAELRFIIVVHLIAQAHRHQPLLQTLQDLHQELNVPEVARKYVETVLTHYTHEKAVNWEGLYVLCSTSPLATPAQLYENVMGRDAPNLQLT
jgi:hypothetical protein